MNTPRWLLVCLSAIALGACGHHTGNSGGTDAPGTGIDGSGPGFIDAGHGADAPFVGTCMAGAPQCSDCIDNDNDGKIDGFDPECTGPLDNDEATFATGIPGDNKDAVNQDCFFDGDSGAGNDGCNIHVCCLLGAPDKASCPIGANKYDPTQCPPPLGTTPLSQKCIDVCGKLAPPGCDCFGCCTLCDTSGTCYDVDINPSTSPNCTQANLSDPSACLRCTKNTMCGNGTCGGTSCILCPGQDPSTLPPSCATPTCPAGLATCDMVTQMCAAGTYCSNGCCIGTIQ